MTIQNPGMKIRILREIKGYTQENMASELSISAKAYQKIERGETQLSISRLNQISGILEMSVIEILSFNEAAIFEKKTSQSENVSSVTNNIVQDFSPIINTKDDLIKSLQSEVDFLRKIIAKNLDL